jgi:hypothetical protein
MASENPQYTEYYNPRTKHQPTGGLHTPLMSDDFSTLCGAIPPHVPCMSPKQIGIPRKRNKKKRLDILDNLKSYRLKRSKSQKKNNVISGPDICRTLHVRPCFPTSTCGAPQGHQISCSCHTVKSGSPHLGIFWRANCAGGTWIDVPLSVRFVLQNLFLTGKVPGFSCPLFTTAGYIAHSPLGRKFLNLNYPD